MKFHHLLQAGLLSALAATAARAQAPIKFNTPGAVQAPAAPAAAFTEAQLVEEVGWLVAKRGSLTDLQFTPGEVNALVAGFAAAMNGKDSPYDLQKMEPELNAFMQGKQAALVTKLKARGQSQTESFFLKLKENKGVVELPSGLRYEIVKAGEGPYPKASETVTVHYTGRLIDGTVFDSSVQRGQPAEFQLDQVIAGWTEGIQKINKGGRIRLYIPPSLAYGDDGRPGIPPGSTLIFDVELLDIKPSAPPKG